MIDPNTDNPTIDFTGAKGLVFLGDTVIIYRRDTNTTQYPLMLDLPGGGREAGETPFETFAREVYEEFGIKLTREDITYSQVCESLRDPNLAAYFLVAHPHHLTADDIQFGEEGLEYFLMDPLEFIAATDGIKGHQEKVRQYLEHVTLT